MSMGVCMCILFRICGCGSGESGCSSCGCCKACARELDGQEARQRGIFDAVKEMIPLDLLLGTAPTYNWFSNHPLPSLAYSFHVEELLLSIFFFCHCLPISIVNVYTCVRSTDWHFLFMLIIHRIHVVSCLPPLFCPGASGSFLF